MTPQASRHDQQEPDAQAAPRVTLSPIEVAHRQRATLIRIVRLAFIVLFATVVILTILDTDAIGTGILAPGGVAVRHGWSIHVVVAMLLAGTVAVIDALTTRKKISTLVAIFVGLVLALLATYALGRIIDLIVEIYDIRDVGLVAATKVFLGIALSYLSIVTVLQTQDDFRLVVPYVEFSKQIRGPRPMLVDSSVLIDARIADLAATGILQSPLIIPDFVVAELQLLADSPDKLRRARGRRGLEVIGKLQRVPSLDVSIDQTASQQAPVDQRLVDLARQIDGVILTTDTALARVAAIRGLRTLNLNEVALAVKPSLIAGELVTLRLVKPGEHPTQAVGYLDDGTMVVAEDGRDLIGQVATLTVVTSLQTAAGRLIFARLAPDQSTPPDDQARQNPRDASAQPRTAPVPDAEHAQSDDDQASAGSAADPLAPEPLGPTVIPPPAPPPRSPFPPKPVPRRPGNSPRNPRR